MSKVRKIALRTWLFLYINYKWSLRELKLSREIKQLEPRWFLQWVSQFWASSPVLLKTERLVDAQPYSPWEVSQPMIHRATVFCKSCVKRSANLLYICFLLKVWWQMCMGDRKETWKEDSRLRLTRLGNHCPKLNFQKVELRSFDLICFWLYSVRAEDEVCNSQVLPDFSGYDLRGARILYRSFAGSNHRGKYGP